MQWKRHGLTLLLFALVGPAVGLVVFTRLGGARVPLGSELGLLAIFAYGIGLLPAALAGLIFTLAWRRPAPIPMLGPAMSGVLLGAASGVVAFAAATLLLRGHFVPASPGVWLVPMLAGAVCGGLASRLLRAPTDGAMAQRKSG
jgi:hypothetical protein